MKKKSSRQRVRNTFKMRQKAEVSLQHEPLTLHEDSATFSDMPSITSSLRFSTLCEEVLQSQIMRNSLSDHESSLPFLHAGCARNQGICLDGLPRGSKRGVTFSRYNIAIL